MLWLTPLPPAKLQAVEKGSRDWEEQRRRIIAAHAPRLMVSWLTACVLGAVVWPSASATFTPLCANALHLWRCQSASRYYAAYTTALSAPPTRSPCLQSRGYKAHLDLLVRRAVEGNAWQADHILPVYKVSSCVYGALLRARQADDVL